MMATKADNEGRIDANAAAAATSNAEKPVFALRPQALASFFENEGTVIKAEEIDLEIGNARIISTGIRIIMDVGGVKKLCITSRKIFPGILLSDMKQPDDRPITRNPHYPSFEEDRATLLGLEKAAYESIRETNATPKENGKKPLEIEEPDRSTVIISQTAYARLGKAVLMFYRQLNDEPSLPPEPVI